MVNREDNNSTAQCSSKWQDVRCAFGEGHKIDYHSDGNRKWADGVSTRTMICCGVCGNVEDYANVEVCRLCYAGVEEGARVLKTERDACHAALADMVARIKGSVECVGDIDTCIKVDECECEGFLANSDGVRGSGKRVYRRFPIVRSWSGKLVFLLWDDQMPEQIFVDTLKDAGLLIGVGRRRPENKGFFGRFVLNSYEWLDRVEVSAAALTA
jgi:hypothetical protein